MDNRRKLALYPAYYLARFNEVAYARLGYGTMNETHRAIAEILDVKQTTLKQMRDEFDPLFGNRAGWYQKKMIVSRELVAKAMEGLGENDVFAIVTEILNRGIQNADSIAVLLAVPGSSDRKKSSPVFVPRGPTGRKAEEIFMKWYAVHKLPAAGRLIDTRELGTGYDFEIETENSSLFVEVKGIGEAEGGIGFTGKEWETALRNGDSYYLVVVAAVKSAERILLIQNPASKLKPKQNIITTIQVNWSITSGQLSAFY
ncbi:DUF3883 domain-containing protein [Mucilaginibacter aquatilis]|uniref:DUF3883 domain-containing protein n=1 Tax=Mucilaginibacter aquatilis TaxID=1517760 RepID=A0A6I4IC69_9SPHI|nr:DUF3883 domain-containing protein [Mucilaginibacter aquatilis]MVN91458.1 DUF3883 domain-containing protein [Mucilaginibacter aquatilis]